MKSSRRFLLVFGAAILALAALMLILTLTLGGQEAPLFPADTPQGVVQRYLQALDRSDYTTAATYLATTDINGKPLTPPFTPYPVPEASRPAHRVSLGQVSVSGTTATVEVVVETFRPAGPFNNSVMTNHISFSLRQESGNWRIAAPTDYYWFLY